jgi:hypothetical protein
MLQKPVGFGVKTPSVQRSRLVAGLQALGNAFLASAGFLLKHWVSHGP